MLTQLYYDACPNPIPRWGGIRGPMGLLSTACVQRTDCSTTTKDLSLSHRPCYATCNVSACPAYGQMLAVHSRRLGVGGKPIVARWEFNDPHTRTRAVCPVHLVGRVYVADLVHLIAPVSPAQPKNETNQTNQLNQTAQTARTDQMNKTGWWTVQHPARQNPQAC